MGVYDFQKATAERIADIFRVATIGPDGKELKSGGQRRVLLADEVGLGKTIVASEVIARVRELRKMVNDDMFRVVYVCSNMNIVQQNIANLGIKDRVNIGESRLSMQHLVIAQKDRELKSLSGKEMPEMIIPLTPGTSFSGPGAGIGNIPERALMSAVLSRMDEFRPVRYQLKDFFRGPQVAEGSWSWEICNKKYNESIDALGDEYIRDISENLRLYPEFAGLTQRLIRICTEEEPWSKEHGQIINGFRRVFAVLSLSMLQPDLIIMDEFQRFSTLLDYKDENKSDSEQSAIVRKFFEQEGGQEPMILLLSATPYKPYTTLEELNESNVDDHYEDFNRLMEFLFSNGSEFREIWSDYSHRLSHLKNEKFDVILASKKKAENKMYEGVCRTERLNQGLISTSYVGEIPVSEGDVRSYCEMQNIVHACKEAASACGIKKFHRANMPVEYVKSSPYLLSFMDAYELKKKIEEVYRSGVKGLPIPSENVLIREKEINQYHRIRMSNARMQYLRDIMLPRGRGAEFLLWVPASKPYYTTNLENPFVRNKDFSKVLVFSAWEMVPRMIATLMTYEAEREVIFSRYKKASYDKRTGGNRIKRDLGAILTYPSEFLAGLYAPKDYFGERIHSIKSGIRSRLKEVLRGIELTERRNYEKILRVVEWLDNMNGEKPENMPANTVDILTDMAIASPGVCLYRILGDKNVALSSAEGFVTLFNRRIAGYIIDRMQNTSHGDETYLEGILDYCILGNLQAVLDEYRHMCANNDDFAEKMRDSFIREVPLQVDTFESFYEMKSSKKAMRTSYAVPFAKTVKSLDSKAEKRTNNIRVAFQSPFYPFVLASTSVGQEGLDFHWYCRKIVHWNLPSNPQDLEQREGRINRYKCLAIRRNVARMFPAIYDWQEIFETANLKVREEFGNRYSGMVPNWCLPVEWITEREKRGLPDLERIERIVPQYPMSSDVERYRHLIKVLSLYRLTMGQPRQEELLEMLERQNITPEQITELLFNLSPMEREKKEVGQAGKKVESE